MAAFWRYRIDQIVFWFVTIAFHMFTREQLLKTAGFEQFALEIFVRNTLLAGLIYLNWLVLVPRFARRGQIATYIVSLLGALAIYILAKNTHDVYLAQQIGDQSKSSFFNNSFYNFSIALFYLAFHIALQLSKEWYFQQELIRQMKIEKLTSELEYLKAQMNPHFVFNSINTIYFQIDKENVIARKSLSAFSDMLRYQLYECNGNEIAIEKEIAYLRNYIDLQRMRKDENYNIAFSVGEEVKGITVCPLLFIPFVENAFKHVSHFPKGNEVKIRIEIQNNELLFSVYNTRETKPVSEGHAGIGLNNVKRRLELLYKDKHSLVVDEGPASFHVNLSLTIK